MTSTARNFIIFIVVISLIGIVYFGFIKSDTSGSDLELLGNGFVTGDGTMGASASVAGDITSLLYQIKQLKIDNTLFNNPAYQYLLDYTVEVPALPIGRPNPFAPIGRNSVGTTTATTTSRSTR